MKRAISLLLTAVMLLSVISVSFVVNASTDKLPFTKTASMTKILSGFAKTSKAVYKLSDGKKTTIGKLKYGGQAPFITQGATMINGDCYISATYKSAYGFDCGYIMKYDTSAKKMYVSESLPVGHANDLCYNPDNNWLLVSNNKPDGTIITIVNPDDLTLIKQVSLKHIYGDTTTGCYSIAYNTDTKEYIVCSSGTNTMNYILDKNFKVVRSHQRQDLNLDSAKKPYYLKQGMHATPDYVMHVYAGAPIGSYVNKIVVTDWDGNYIQTVTDTIKSEIEDLFADEDGRFYAAYHNQSAGGYIYEMKMTTFTCKYDANGGKGTMADSEHTYGTSKALTANSFTKEMHTFAGWNLSRKSDGKSLYTNDNGKTTYWFKPGEQPSGYVLALYADKQKVSALSAAILDEVYLTAQWTPYSFTVSYNKNGGKGTMSATKAYYNKTAKLSANTFTRANYEFMGWNMYQNSSKKYLYEAADGTTGWYKSGKQPKGWTMKVFEEQADITNFSLKNKDAYTAYAIWRKIKYTVQYDANGGTGTMASAVFERGTSKALANNTFTKANHTFKGWVVSRESDGKTLYVKGKTTGWYPEGEQPEGYTVSIHSNKQKVSALADVYGDVVTCTAQWVKYYYTVAYNKNGGTGSMPSRKVDYNQSFILDPVQFTRTNYDFVGWEVYRNSDKTYLYVGEDGTEGWYKNNKQPKGWTRKVIRNATKVCALSSKNGDTVTLYASWRAITYTVQYLPNGGTGTMANSSHQRGVNKALTANAYKMTGYSFKGWTLERQSDGKKLYIKGKTSTWYTEGEQPDGYTLAIYSNKQKVSALTNVYGDLVTCTAQWATNKYTIAYNKNSGKGSMSNTTAYYGKQVALRANTFTRSGYKFAGWTVYRKSDKTYLYSSVDETATGWYKKNKQPSGWVKYVYLDKANVLNLATANGDTITMYAEWSNMAVADETISAESTLAYTLKGLVTPRAVQNFCITDEYVYITQRVVSSTYVSRLKKNDENKTAVFMDYMEIVNGGHGQALDAYTYNGKEYLYMAVRAETYSEQKYFSLEAARFIYEPNVTLDYTELNRFVDMNYANPSGKKLGTTYRVAVGCNDDYTIFRVQTREGSVTYSTYDTAKINELLDGSHTVSMNTAAARNACIKSFTQSGVTIVRPNDSFQGVDILDDDKLFITGGVDGQLPKMAYMSDTGHYNKLIKMAGVGTCEIEGVQCRDNNLYFLVIPDITTKADSQQIRYIPEALGMN